MGRRKQRRRSGKRKPKLDTPKDDKPTPDSSQTTANPGYESDTSVSDNELQSESQDDSKISLLESSTHEEETNNANSQETCASVSQQDLTEKTASSDSRKPSIIYSDSDDMVDHLVEACGTSDVSTEGDYKISESSSTTASSDQETTDASEIRRVYGNFDIIPAPPRPCMYVDVTDFFEARAMNRLINLLCGVDPNDPNLQGAVGGASADAPPRVPDAQGLKLIDLEEVKGPLFVMEKPWCAPDPIPTEWYTGMQVVERDDTLKITKRRTPMFQTYKKAIEYNRKLNEARRMARNDPNDPPDPTTLLKCDQCSFTTRRNTELHDHKADKHRRRDKRGKP